MATVGSTSLPTDWSVADMLKHLGIPPQRILIYPPPGVATEEDVLDVRRRTGRLCELVDGVLVEKAMGFYEAILAGELLYYLRDYLQRNPIGVVAAADGMLQILPHQVRIPDVSFVRWERFPGQRPSRGDPIPSLAPDLAVEILSAGNTEEEMQRKLGEYFEAGSRLVWYIDPETRSANLYTSPAQSTTVHQDEILDGGDVLPGFQLRLGDLFDGAERGAAG